MGPRRNCGVGLDSTGASRLVTRIDLNTNSRSVRACFYLALPMFFLYHSIVGQGWIPTFLGGYSTAMAALLLPVLAFNYAKHLLSGRNHRLALDGIYAAFVGYYACVLAVQYANGTHSHAVPEQFGIAFQFVTLFMLSRLAPLGDPKFQRNNLILLLLMTGLIISNADDGTFIIASLELYGVDENLANYQAYAFVYSSVMLYVLAPMKKRWQRVLIYAIGIPTLFLNGARTEFIGVILLVLVMEFIESRHKLATLLVAAAAVGIGIASLPYLADLFPESRTVFLFLDYSDDRSAQERAEMLHAGWKTISEHPWLGDFQSHARGAHIHNGLSAWVDLGLAGFVAYVALIAVPAFDIFILQRGYWRVPSYRLTFAMIFLTALFALTAKHYTHQLFPLALGIYARFLLERKNEDTNAHIQLAALEPASPNRSTSMHKRIVRPYP